MDDEDGRCLLDVICDPQALNDFLHGSEKIDSDDLLDNSGDAASAFFEGAGLHGQEAAGNPLSAEPSQPPASVDLDFLEDDILGSPGGAGAGAETPCDILQQSLQEANITEQTLEAEAELDLGSFQLPALQPVVPAADGAAQIFPGGDLLGLQPPAVLQQALVQPPDAVNKALSVQPFLQPVGLGNVTIQPLPNLPGLPNGSAGGALGLGPIQVLGQQVMAINQPISQPAPQPLLAKPAPVATVGGYIAQPEAAAAASQGAGLVIQKSLPATAAAALNGGSVFAGGGVSAASGQPLAVTSGPGGSLVPAPNVIIHRTPTPIQPKPAGVLQQKLYQISPKPFAPGAALALPGEAPAKAPQNLTFMAGKAAPNVVLQSFPQNVFKAPPQPQPPALGKSMSVHVLNQGGSIVIPAQPFQGQNQFLLPGQLAGASAVPLPQPLSALPANVGGQLLPGAGQTHIIAGQGGSAQLLTNPALPAQLLNPGLAGQLNLGPVLASPGAAGTAHILSAAPIQLQPGQVAPPALFQMPVSLAGPGATSAPTVIQGVTLASPVAMLNADSLGGAVGVQGAAGGSGSPEPEPSAGLANPPASSAASMPAQASPGLAQSPEKILLGTTASGAVLGQESVQMFLQQVPQGLLLQPKAPPSSPAASVLLPAANPGSAGATLGANAAAGSAAPAEAKPFSSVATAIPGGKGAPNPGKSGAALPQQQPGQAKPVGVKGTPQPSGGGKGNQLEAKLALKKTPVLQPSKEACLLEQLHKHQGAVLHPEFRTPFRSVGDALRRLLPYHVYQGMLPAERECQRVDEEFEAVSEQLLRRTRAMLNKYRLLLLEESRRASPSAEMVMIDRIFIQEEKTALALDRQLARDKPDEYVSSSSNSSSSSSSSSSSRSHPLPHPLPPSSQPSPAPPPPAPPAPPPAPPKLLIKHGGSSPSVTWLGDPRDTPRDTPRDNARDSAARYSHSRGDARDSRDSSRDEDALPSRSRPPMKTYEARSRIGLKLKIKQEAGLSKVVHNTALDPPGIPPGMPPGAAAAQLNGSLERKTPPGATPCRLPLRKTYRENRESREEGREVPRSERRPVIAALRREPSAPRLRGKGAPEEPSDGEEEEEEEEGPAGRAEPPWAGKRRKAEVALEVDNASFSSDSPQDDSLSEHLQSAIDSILNLQQPARNPSGSSGSSSGSSGSSGSPFPPRNPSGSPFPARNPSGPSGSPFPPRNPSASSGSPFPPRNPSGSPFPARNPSGPSGSPFPAPSRRSEPLLPPPSHNGGLGAARTCSR